MYNTYVRSKSAEYFKSLLHLQEKSELVSPAIG